MYYVEYGKNELQLIFSDKGGICRSLLAVMILNYL